MIPFVLTLTFPILFILVFVIPGTFLCFRWLSMFTNDRSDIDVGDMKIPTFYATEPEKLGEGVARIVCMSVVGVVFGGIHCVGWFFNFPSNAEAILWRVSSAVLTGIAFLFPIFFAFAAIISRILSMSFQLERRLSDLVIGVFSIMLVLYVVSRLLLLVEAFISLRHLTPGMLALVKWTSFIPHI